MHYIAGILKHAPALAAFTNPTINSYRRLVPGRGAGPPRVLEAATARRRPYRCTRRARRRSVSRVRFDPTANGYLAFSAMLMAGLDGIENRLAAGDPLDKDITH